MNDRFDLIRYRKNLGYNQVLLAALLGVSQQNISQMESGGKPLSTKALQFIRQANHGFPNGKVAIPPKNAKKVVEKSLKTRELQVGKLPDLTDMRLVTEKEAMSDYHLWKKWWWQIKHPLCLRCVNECRQSSQVGIICCPQFKTIEASL